MKKEATLRTCRLALILFLSLAGCAGFNPFSKKNVSGPDGVGSPVPSSHVYYGESNDVAGGPESEGEPSEVKATPEEAEDAQVSEEAEDVTFLSEIERPETEEGVCPQVPIETNERVNFFLGYFQGSKREWMGRALQRSGRYVGQMREILREEGLPEDLVYLALIESGYNPYAYSHAGAVGIWQFIPGTGRRYGLRIDWWVDERRDLEKSTRAAARYLKDLYAQFGDWYIAAAAYNAGEGKLARAIAKCDSNNFWDISAGKRGSLRNETKDYVPKFLAALMIAKEPARYGFEITYDQPLLYEVVGVSDPIDLTVAARASGGDIPLLRSLNPQLKRGYTPPGYPEYALKVPQGTADRFRSYCAKLEPSDRVTFRRHVVKRGETLGTIARRYGLSVTTIAKTNGISEYRRIRTGTSLEIPVSLAALNDPTQTDRFTASAAQAESAVQAAAGGAREDGSYRVRVGDTLWKISKKFGVTVSSLCVWNKLGRSSRIYPGQTIVVSRDAAGTEGAPPVRMAKHQQGRATFSPVQPICHVVQPGDTLWRISRKYGVTLPQLCTWNQIELHQTLRPGSVIRVYTDRQMYADVDSPAAGTAQD
ncbi:MAG: LysM peptidoglycan-binding domain-containing protein [bacterium]